MKSVTFKVVLENDFLEMDKLASAIQTVGFNDKSMGDQLQLLGIVTNLQFIIQERISKLAQISSDD